MQGQTSEQTQVIIIPLVIVGFRFQTDDFLLLLDVGWKRDHAYTSYRMIDNAINEKSDIRLEFAHPRGIRSLIDGPLQDVGFSDAFEKVIKVLAVSNETGLVQVASTAITIVSQNEPVTEVNLERIGLFLEHDLQRRF